jgi:hypothetical protein
MQWTSILTLIHSSENTQIIMKYAAMKNKQRTKYQQNTLIKISNERRCNRHACTSTIGGITLLQPTHGHNRHTLVVGTDMALRARTRNT